MATDNFNRTDAATLGASWTEIVTGYSISSNTATPKNFSGTMQCAYYTGAASGSDQFSQCTTTNAYIGGPGVRLSDGGGGTVSGYFLRGGVGDGGIALYRYNAGTPALLQDFTSQTMSDGGVYRIEAQGTTIRCYKNAVQLGTDQTEGTHSTGQPGIFGVYNTYDIHDDWSGGDLSAPAAARTGLTTVGVG